MGVRQKDMQADSMRRLEAMKRALSYREEYYAAKEWEHSIPYKKVSQEDHEATLAYQIEKDRQLLEDALAERFILKTAHRNH